MNLRNLFFTIATFALTASTLHAAEPGIGELRSRRDEVIRQLEATDDIDLRLQLINERDRINKVIADQQIDPLRWHVDIKAANDLALQQHKPVVMVFVSPVQWNFRFCNQMRAAIFSEEFRSLANRGVFVLIEKDPDTHDATRWTREIFKAEGSPQIVIYDREKKTVLHRIVGARTSRELTTELNEKLPAGQ